MSANKFVFHVIGLPVLCPYPENSRFQSSEAPPFNFSQREQALSAMLAARFAVSKCSVSFRVGVLRSFSTKWCNFVVMAPLVLAAEEAASAAKDPFSAALASYGIPAVALIAVASGALTVAQKLGRLENEIAGNERLMRSAMAAAEAKIAANEKVAASAIASAETKLAANEKAAASAIASTEAKLAANEKVSEAKLAAAKDVIASMVAGVAVTAKLATLEALQNDAKASAASAVTGGAAVASVERTAAK